VNYLLPGILLITTGILVVFTLALTWLAGLTAKTPDGAGALAMATYHRKIA
jgi:hypothetical protein